MTNAKITQASMKLRNRWPCQKFGGDGARFTSGWATAVVASLDSASGIPETFCAVDPQISHVLEAHNWRNQSSVEYIIHHEPMEIFHRT